MNAWANRLQPYATWRNLVLLGGCCLILNVALIWHGMTFANSNRLLDVQLLYTQDEAHEFLKQIDTGGRTSYLWQLLTLDLVYPPLYALWLSLALVKVDSQQRRSFLLTLPLAAAACDWAENLGIGTQIWTYRPEEPSGVAWFTMSCTLLKWMLVAASMLALAVGLVQRAFAPFARTLLREHSS